MRIPEDKVSGEDRLHGAPEKPVYAVVVSLTRERFRGP
jgi:hypothetical protein